MAIAQPRPSARSKRGESATQDAKTPATPLAGPYGHPFHPIFVTIPIGAWTIAVIFDVVRIGGADPEFLAKASQWLIGTGAIGAIVASMFGLLDLMTIPRRTKAFATGITHMILNTVALLAFAGSFLLRADTVEDGTVTGVAFGLALAALAVLGVSGWLGGKLAYHYGVRVADEETQAAGYR